MNLKLVALMFQAALIAAHTNDGCYMKDNTTFTGDHLTYVANISTVTQCASLCRANVSCSYWTLLKDSGYCDLWETTAGNRTESSAISGSKACGDEIYQPSTTPTPIESTASALCLKTQEIFKDECLENEISDKEKENKWLKDDKHCQEILKHLEEFCGFDNQTLIPVSTVGTLTTSLFDLCPFYKIYAAQYCREGKEEEGCEGIMENIEENCS